MTIARPGSRLGPYLSGFHRRWLTEQPEQRWQAVEGSLVFADVSGFTPLAERLAQRGKVGAEELTDILNDLFSELLDVAGRHGGDCLKFGGDALLLLFLGPGHPRRAVAAAEAMQATLRALRKEQGRLGGAKLDISMGVHSGTIHAFLAGRSHRELVVAGPAVTRVLELEAAAQGGEVRVSEATTAALAEPDRQVDDSGVDDLDEIGDPDGAPSAGIPEALRPFLDGSRREGEHRLATVGFLKFAGLDDLLAASGPDAVAVVLDELVAEVQRACTQMGATFVATDVDVGGGKIILAAGVPSASDDDDDHLLLATRSILETTAASPLALRAGAHRGRIFAVDLGSAFRRTYTVMGDAVNLAARVMGKAGTGQLVATQEVLDRRRSEFELDRLEPFTVKGKAQPIAAQVVGRAVGRRAERDGGSTPLVGRRDEAAAIVAACASARSGSGRIVELVGEPGIGKSRLLAHAVEAAEGLVHLRFEAGRYSLATPYFALRRGLREAMGLSLDAPSDQVEAALREVVATSAPELAPWISLLGVPLGLELPDSPRTAKLDADRRRATLQEAVVSLMGEVLSGPTLVTVEDGHWLDAASGDLLRALLGQIDRRPWAVVVTRRPVSGGLDLGEIPVTRLALEPLGHDALVELALGVEGSGTLPPGAVDSLVERSGGNPLFLQELVRAATRGGLAELPESVEAVVAAGIDTLALADRDLLRHAAVLGGQFPVSVLAGMLESDLDSVLAGVDRLTHFVGRREDGTVRFRHILLRDVAYEGLAFRVRRRLHERAGNILERSGAQPEAIAELLSIHFHLAARFDASWRYARVAAERARHNGASVEAAAFYERALEAGAQLPGVRNEELSVLAEGLGDACELSGRYAQSGAAYLRARRLAGADPARTALLCRKLGYLRDHEGRYGSAQRWFRRGLADLDDVGDQAEAARLWAELTTAAVSSRIRLGRYGKTRPMIEAAIAAAERSGDRAALAHAYFVLDQLLVDQGRYTEARHSERAAAIYEELGDDRGAAAAYNEVGTTAYWLGRWDDAVASYERAIEADRRAGALVYIAIYLNNIGEIRSDQGRWVEARGLLEEAHDLWTSGGWRIGSAWASSNLGRLAARDGRLDDAAGHLARAAATLADIGAEAMLLETDAREMERLVLAGDHGAALAVADPLAERARRLGVANVGVLVQRVAGYAWAQAGFPEAAWEQLEECLAGSRKSEAEYEAALTLEAMARVGRMLDRPGLDLIESEAAAIFQRLRVVATPTVPLPG